MWENENAGMENARNGKCGTKTAGGGGKCGKSNTCVKK